MLILFSFVLKKDPVQKFKELLAEAGIAPVNAVDIARVNRVIEMVFHRFTSAATSCVTSYTAKALFEQARNLPTTRTVNAVARVGVHLDGPLDGAYSNKASLEKVLIFDSANPGMFKLKIFKAARDRMFEHAILADITFCATVKSRLSCFPNFMVEYEPFEFKTSENLTVSGSISKQHVTYVAAFNGPFRALDLLVHFNRLTDVLNALHQVNLCIIDIKPENIYVMDDTFAFADYGGAGEIDSPLGEHTIGFIPEEFIQEARRSAAIDKFCLVVTFLKLLTQDRLPTVTVEIVRNAVRGLEESELKKNMLKLIAI